MKLDEKHSIEEQIYMEEEDNAQHQHRWTWVRRFILSIILITCAMQSFYYVNDDTQDIFTSTVTDITQNSKKSHIVLHTGFPPTQDISGLPIEYGKAAATAFSPNPSNTKKQIDMKHLRTNDESWWDRLFPNSHVHLVSVQMPVVGKKTNSVNATLSICASKRSKFGPNSPQIPDLTKCVNSASVQTQDVDPEDLFGVLEWVPDTTIVLKKSKMYWLVVQAPSQDAAFEWVYAQGGSNHYGTAYETELGWEFKLEGEPIPSAMLMVDDHVKN
ncbi:hypothetical protein [Parasitella parasitica]|uniref:Uncharacterized protein n=1 Tax=Parasitella parasitica TaxID=35722 RepID=A0A0B7NX12_9FUNG|nr:hypothetical protein [Parasitella parasitica]